METTILNVPYAVEAFVLSTQILLIQIFTSGWTNLLDLLHALYSEFLHAIDFIILKLCSKHDAPGTMHDASPETVTREVDAKAKKSCG